MPDLDATALTALTADDHVITLTERAIALARTRQLAPAHAAIAVAGEHGVHGAAAARLMLARAYAAYFDHDPEQGRARAAEAEALAEAAGAPALAARCVAVQAACDMRAAGEHRWRQVLAQLARAQARAAQPTEAPHAKIDRRETVYLASTLSATIDHYAGRLDRALKAYARALACCTEAGDSTGMGALRHRIGFLQSDRLREQWFDEHVHRADRWQPAATALVEAMAQVQSSVDFAQVNGVPTNLPMDQVQLAFLLRIGGNSDLALSLLARALDELDRLSPASGETIYGHADRCLCLLDAGRLDEAQAASGALLGRLTDTAVPSAAAQAWRAQQWVCETLGDVDGALEAQARSQTHWHSYRDLQRQIVEVLDASAPEPTH